MQKILKGVRTFRTVTFKKQKALYLKLSKGQWPMAMFITCADSRIVPSALTHTGAGELFIVRNAGNFVPKNGSAPSGEAASLEYAVKILEIRDIIVCGHTECGAIKYLVESKGGDLPHVDNWVKNGADLLNRFPRQETQFAYRQNVVLQLEHLLTYPFVAEAIAKKKLTLHGWLFDINNGDLLRCDPETKSFEPIVGAK